MVPSLFGWTLPFFLDIDMAESQKEWEFERTQKTLIHLAIGLLTAAIICCVFPYAMCTAKPDAWHYAEKVKIGMNVDQVRSTFRHALDAEPTYALMPTLAEYLTMKGITLKDFDGPMVCSQGRLMVLKGAIDHANLPKGMRIPRHWENAQAYASETKLDWRVSNREPAADYFREFPERKERFEGVLRHWAWGNSFLVWGYNIKFHFIDGKVTKIEREEID